MPVKVYYVNMRKYRAEYALAAKLFNLDVLK